MTLIMKQITIKNVLLFFVLAMLLGIHDLILFCVYYQIFRFVWKALDNEIFNRIGFAVLCSCAGASVYYLIHLG